jgi:hypothetical protein
MLGVNNLENNIYSDLFFFFFFAESTEKYK